MKVYAAALAHVRLQLAITCAGVVATVLTDRFHAHSVIPFALTALALVWANRRLGRFVCPRCRSNLFVRGRLAWPWPNKVCWRCGLDLRTDQG